MMYKIVGTDNCYGESTEVYFSTKQDWENAKKLLYFFGIVQGADNQEDLYFEAFFGKNIENESSPNYD